MRLVPAAHAIPILCLPMRMPLRYGEHRTRHTDKVELSKQAHWLPTNPVYAATRAARFSVSRIVRRIDMRCHPIRWPGRARQYMMLLATLAVFGLWGATALATTRAGQRLRLRAAQVLGVAHYCDNREGTIVGTPGDDVLRGTPGRDVIIGLEGNDTLYGDGDNDWLCGNEGDDLLVGGSGADTLTGHDGADTLIGDQGADILRGSAGGDRLFGGADDDTLVGGAGDDALEGGDQIVQDVCYGGTQAASDRATNCEIVSNIP